MKVNITTLTPDYAKKVEDHITNVITKHESLQNTTGTKFPHPLTCGECYAKCLVEFWLQGIETDVLKTMPEWLLRARTITATYQATETDGETQVAYEGTIIPIETIPHIISARTIHESHDFKPLAETLNLQPKKRRTRPQQFNSLEEVLNYIFKEIGGSQP